MGFDRQISILTGGTEIPCSGPQKWEIENTDTANSIFVNEELMPPSAATSGGSEVAAGLTRTFFFDGEKTPMIRFKAATATVLINIRKTNFRSRILFVLAEIAAGIAKEITDQFWQRVSATVVKLAGAYTEARADTFDRKTAATGLVIGTNAIANGIRIGGAVAQSGGNVRVASADGTDWLQVVNSGIAAFLNSAAVFNCSDTEVQARVASLVQYAGAGTDPRHTLSSTALTTHTPVAGGAISSVYKTLKLPIKNGDVIANADIVVYDQAAGGNANRVMKQNAVGDVAVAGVAISGGTGDPGGTVMAEFVIDAFLVGALVGNGSCTTLQYLILGAATVNRVDSSTVRTNASFGRVFKTTAVDGTVIDAKVSADVA
jgi:hypothetical protein